MSTSFRTLTTKNGSLPRIGRGGAFRGRFMVRPLASPVHTWTSRRGGGGVDEAGGGLWRPPPPPHPLYPLWSLKFFGVKGGGKSSPFPPQARKNQKNQKIF